MTKTIALLGNPNSGKTTLFNQLTGRKQRVGNWHGVTVEKKSGTLSIQGENVTLIDLPGTYSLSTCLDNSALDERIACDYLRSHQADLIVNVVDASNLERHLYLTAQLVEMNIPCIIAVNMIDIAKKRGLHIDLEELSQRFKRPAVGLISTKKKGLNQLLTTLEETLHTSSVLESPIQYPPTVQAAIQELTQTLPHHPSSSWHALRLLEGDTHLENNNTPNNALEKATALRKTIEHTAGEECDLLIADCRYQQIHHIVSQVQQHSDSQQRTLTDTIDRITLNRWTGIPFFLLTMYVLFILSINLGGALQPLFQVPIDTVFIDGIHHWGAHTLPFWLTTILADGVGTGLDTIAGFIPQIGLMFLFLAFLEDSGYMARAAFVMDRLMQWVGLPGKAFVPLIVGFGCNVPAIMATRTLEQQEDRILTSMMAPFMSCSARLAIFAVFASAFFPHGGATVIFFLYLLGIFAALMTGLLLKKTVLKSKPAPFIMELPAYHVPHIRSLFLMAWQRLKAFVIRAGKLILPACVLIGSLNHLTLPSNTSQDLHPPSLLATLSKEITPLFHPIGIHQENWPATVGLITGTLAKEVVVATLNTLYHQHERTQSSSTFHFWNDFSHTWTDTFDNIKQMGIRTFTNPFAASEADHAMDPVAKNHMVAQFGGIASTLAYLIFVLLYIPCISTVAILAREINHSWAVFSTAWSLSIAYSFAVLAYQSLTWAQHPLSATLWIAGIVIYKLLWVFSLQRFKPNTRRVHGHSQQA